MEDKRDSEIELRSEEVQELMSQIPAWILRWGICLVGIILSGMLVGACFFEYPDTLTADIVVTTAAPPIEIYAQTTGNLEYVNIKNHQPVDSGMVMAAIESTARYGDVAFVRNEIDSWKKQIRSLAELDEALRYRQLSLGNMQAAFAEFTTILQNYLQYKEEDYYQKKIDMKKKLQKEKTALEQNNKSARTLHKKQAVIASKLFRRDSILYSQKLISEEAYNNAEQAYLHNNHTAIDDQDTQTQMGIDRLNDQETILDLRWQQQKTESEMIQSLYNSCEQLTNAIRQYEKDYLLKAPISGIVNMMGSWEKNVYVEAGSLIVIIIPNEKSVSMGRAKLPVAGAGKVKTGLEVKVRLDNFPENEYGYIKGVVKSVSAIPDEKSNYFLEISFPQGLMTNYRLELPQSKTMIGTAEIIVKDKRLIEAFLEPIVKFIRH